MAESHPTERLFPEVTLNPDDKEMIERGKKIRALGGEAYVDALWQEHREDRQGQRFGPETTGESV